MRDETLTAPNTQADSLGQPDAVFFDMDGVLADVSDSYRRAIVEVCSGYGVEVSTGAVSEIKLAGNANDDYYVAGQLLGRARVEVDPAELRRRFDALYWGSPERPGLRHNERLLPDRSMLRRLAKNYGLAIVTGRPRIEALTFLHEQRIASLFPVVVASEDAPLKPDPAPVTMALQALGVRTAWLVGDTPDDMRAARRARVVPIGVVAPSDDPMLVGPALREAGAIVVLDSVNDIGGLL